jgi:glucose-6-phosphate 1-dehydrogenase
MVKGFADSGLIRKGRVVVEKPFGHDMASAHELADQLHQYIDESQLTVGWYLQVEDGVGRTLTAPATRP